MDEQIREHEKVGEHEKAIIKLKRTRNSLLNVSKFPPEVLGEIFCWNVTFKDRFGGLEKRSHNFLLVCRHWFEVASCTPEIWSFWGNAIKDWARRYTHSRTAPLDLVLDGGGGLLNITLYNELQDRAARDTIRRVHLRANSSELLSSIISSLTAKCEGTRTNSVESVVLRTWGGTPIGVSDFFAHYRFPKLRCLDLKKCTIPWDHLASRTGALTVLRLGFIRSSTPTTSQLLSILASNPLLQKITLDESAIPLGDGDTTSVRVPLHNLKELELVGNPRNAIKFLHRLDYPRRMDDLTLTLGDCSVMEISQVIGPCLRDHLRGRGESQHGLGLFISSSLGFASFSPALVLHVGDVHGINPLLRRMGTFMKIEVGLNEPLRGNARERLILNLLAHTPGEEVVHFQTCRDYRIMRNIYPRFQNLRALSFAGGDLQTMVPEPDPGGDKEILVSLQHISLQQLSLDRGDWSPLINFLACRVSSGNRLDTVEISDSSPMCPEVVEVVGGMVRELGFDRHRPIFTRG